MLKLPEKQQLGVFLEVFEGDHTESAAALTEGKTAATAIEAGTIEAAAIGPPTGAPAAAALATAAKAAI